MFRNACILFVQALIMPEKVFLFPLLKTIYLTISLPPMPLHILYMPFQSSLDVCVCQCKQCCSGGLQSLSAQSTHVAP